MCNFKVGDEVVAINDGGPDPLDTGIPDLVAGSFYTITDLCDHAFPCVDCGSEIIVSISEINCDEGGYCVCSFRKVERRNITEWLSQSVGNTDKLDKKKVRVK